MEGKVGIIGLGWIRECDHVIHMCIGFLTFQLTIYFYSVVAVTAACSYVYGNDFPSKLTNANCFSNTVHKIILTTGP